MLGVVVEVGEAQWIKAPWLPTLVGASVHMHRIATPTGPWQFNPMTLFQIYTGLGLIFLKLRQYTVENQFRLEELSAGDGGLHIK